MSTLVLEELWPGVVFVQNITIERDLAIAHLRPWIYKQGTLVDGDFTVRVKQGAILLREVKLNFAEINAGIPSSYAHGFIRVDMHPLVLHVPDGQSSADFIIEFEMTSHTLDSANFMAINRSWENKIYPANYTPPNDIAQPGGLEIYEWRQL